MSKSEFIPGAGMLSGPKVTPLTDVTKQKAADAYEVREFMKRADTLGIDPLKLVVDMIEAKNTTYPKAYETYLIEKGMLTENRELTDHGRRTLEFHGTVLPATGEGIPITREPENPELTAAYKKMSEDYFDDSTVRVNEDTPSIFSHNTENIFLWEQFISFYLDIHKNLLSDRTSESSKIRQNIIGKLARFKLDVEKYGENYLKELVLRYQTHNIFLHNRYLLGYSDHQISEKMKQLKSDIGSMTEWVQTKKVEDTPIKKVKKPSRPKKAKAK